MTRTGFSHMARRAALASALVCGLLVRTIPAPGQNFNDLLGGGDSAFSLNPPTQAPEPVVSVALTPLEVKSATTLQAGDQVRLSIQVELPAGAHTYSQNPGFAGDVQGRGL